MRKGADYIITNIINYNILYIYKYIIYNTHINGILSWNTIITLIFICPSQKNTTNIYFQHALTTIRSCYLIARQARKGASIKESLISDNLWVALDTVINESKNHRRQIVNKDGSHWLDLPLPLSKTVYCILYTPHVPFCTFAFNIHAKTGMNLRSKL